MQLTVMEKSKNVVSLSLFHVLFLKISVSYLQPGSYYENVPFRGTGMGGHREIHNEPWDLLQDLLGQGNEICAQFSSGKAPGGDVAQRLARICRAIKSRKAIALMSNLYQIVLLYYNKHVNAVNHCTSSLDAAPDKAVKPNHCRKFPH